MTLTLFTDIWHILLSFFSSLIRIMEADFISMSSSIGSQMAYVIYAWSSSVSRYGVLIPALFVSFIGITLIGLYLVFVFVDGARDMVGD